jgi:hypothetical protein
MVYTTGPNISKAKDTKINKNISKKHKKDKDL